MFAVIPGITLLDSRLDVGIRAKQWLFHLHVPAAARGDDMGEDKTRNHGARAPEADQPVVLLTGGAGVVGQALLRCLDPSKTLCLVHRTPVSRPGVETVHGDITAPCLGLSPKEYSALAGRIGVIVHSAAVTEFRGDDGSLERTNVVGTQQVVALAEAAGVPLYHLSTAFIDARPTGEWGKTSTRYAASKRAGEAVVAGASCPKAVVRPSVVIGDSRRGEVASFQGLYLVATAILEGLVPMIPFDAGWPIDFVPCDWVAEIIAALVNRTWSGGDVWVTAGPQALPLEKAVELCVELGRQWGIEVDIPRFVPPDLFDRLIGPVFFDALPRRMRMVMTRLLEYFASYLSVASPLPQSEELIGILGVGSLPDPRASLEASLSYWANATGRRRAQEAA
jgi:nucleoside-diphosphate-sugar epimerase